MKIGVVGLGTMGGRIAKRLVDAGHTVTGYNRTPAKADWLVTEGLRLAPTPREAAAGAEIVFSMVTNQHALTAVTDGPDGLLEGLEADAVYADLSTVHPQVSRELSRRVTDRDAVMLDAPVMGTVATFEHDLPLVVLVSGNPDAAQRLRAVLDTINTHVFHIGTDNGQAATLKAAFNLTLPIHLAAFAEGLLLAQKAGIPRELACEIFATTGATSDAIRMRLPFLATLPDEPYFSVVGLQKDLGIALDLGHQAGVPMPLTATINQLLTACRGLGMAHDDFAALYHALAVLAADHDPE